MAKANATKVLLKFADDENFYKCEVQRMSEHMVKVSGLIQDLSGFQIFSESKTMIGDYSEYTYEYDNPNLDDNVFEYTDNEAKYPDEGADKSQKEQIKDELKVYTDELIQKAKASISQSVEEAIDSINKVVSKVEEATEAQALQVDELQTTLIDLYEAINSLNETLNN